MVQCNCTAFSLRSQVYKSLSLAPSKTTVVWSTVVASKLSLVRIAIAMVSFSFMQLIELGSLPGLMSMSTTIVSGLSGANAVPQTAVIPVPPMNESKVPVAISMVTRAAPWRVNHVPSGDLAKVQGLKPKSPSEPTIVADPSEGSTLTTVFCEKA